MSDLENLHEGIRLPAIDLTAPKLLETATFGLGCFWAPDGSFGSLPGVIRTRVGYAGGTKHNPTYRDLGNHTETVQLDYDPTRISYAHLLDVFWHSHNPTVAKYKPQYISLILTHDDTQRQLAEQTAAQQASERGKPVVTEIKPLHTFFIAEDYHQKYALRQFPDVLHEFTAIYPRPDDFTNSTAVARANAYANGFGTREVFDAELEDYGLTPRGQMVLREIFNRYQK